MSPEPKEDTASFPEQSQDIDIVLGRRIRRIRVSRQMSQSELGDRVGVSFQQIQKYEKGSNRISAAALLKIASALDASSAELLDGFQDKAGDGVEELVLESPLSEALLSAFSEIRSTAVRAGLVHLVTILSTEAD